MPVQSSDPATQIFTMEVPAMYADHHVMEVRRLILALPGVSDIYASSCFKTVEVSYDPAQVGEAQITACLGEAGYLGDFGFPEEAGTVAARENGEKPFFRHTAVYDHARQSVNFGQEVIHSGRPLWPCPGMGVVTHTTITPNLMSKMEE